MCSHPSILAEGWLVKEGHVVRNWKTRYCMLMSKDSDDYRKHGHQRLLYFLEPPVFEELDQYKGAVPLPNAQIAAAEVEGHPNAFTITGTLNSKDYVFSAISPAVAQEWITQLQAAAAGREPPPLSPMNSPMSSPLSPKKSVRIQDELAAATMPE